MSWQARPFLLRMEMVKKPPAGAPPLGAGPEPPGPWFGQAVAAVEFAIDRLVEEFSWFPYMHRVEQCLYTRLVQLLREQWPLGGAHALGQTGEYVQLVHKEWPETIPRRERNGRRGNFDVVVLSPPIVAECPDLLRYLEGRLAAPIVIEVGLEYGLPHLVGDCQKLINSNVPGGYLLHLVRGRAPQDNELALLNAPEDHAHGFNRKACVFVQGLQRWIKRVGDHEIQHIPNFPGEH